ncbi:flagellar hook-basal body protein [Pseudobacteriovorax antillogorgiicola]|uniref:Flagellar basal-body rod protein FlgG n=1 Tax=Pseudobacteriovorax antillogorgiicola TaxID=1513793 RepID=A0A1Y6B284_9BACT|nr:flagellar hook-basal body protein [Pseudobacteriovorax antillogorgiicola]TCS59524.1 flagellar basal-body rod protein FlgG [Pseudobacteriovorax antillogorgiicola]SME87851.1 flagellar basal-body rod protein FlgG [Pseudobacteriovorax antillogorgiicola]
MLKNIYTPLAGAIAQERALETLSNNLANVNTVGFKGDNVTFTLQDPEPFKNYPTPLPPANFKVDLNKVGPLKGNDLSYVGIAGIETDFTQGPAINTHNKLDLMIEGQGMFSVQTNEGIRFQRAGDLTLNQEGALASKAGDPILGEKGVVYLRSNQFHVNRLGEVYQDGEFIDRIQIYQFKSPEALERVGNNYYFYGGPADDVSQSETATLKQGFLEGSNVNPIKNLTALIVSHRSYEAYQKAVSNYDQMMDKTSNSLGEVRA